MTRFIPLSELRYDEQNLAPELDDDTPPPWMCDLPACQLRANHRGQCSKRPDAPMASWVDCCQHSAFTFALLQGVRFCLCSACGHRWSVILGGADKYGVRETDGTPNEMAGVEARQ
jgi:hypothetical protein